jgi:hypothetical protein
MFPRKALRRTGRFAFGQPVEDVSMPAQRTTTPGTIGNAVPLSASPLGRAATMLVVAASLLSAAVLPSSLVLPALSIFFVCIGFSVAAGLYLGGHRMQPVRHPAWDLAGLLVFLGFAAAILTDVTEALAEVERLSTRMTGAASS